MNELPHLSHGAALQEVVRLQSENQSLRIALRLIAEAEVEGLDPKWAVRVARFALEEAK